MSIEDRLNYISHDIERVGGSLINMQEKLSNQEELLNILGKWLKIFEDKINSLPQSTVG